MPGRLLQHIFITVSRWASVNFQVGRKWNIVTYHSYGVFYKAILHALPFPYTYLSHLIFILHVASTYTFLKKKKVISLLSVQDSHSIYIFISNPPAHDTVIVF